VSELDQFMVPADGKHPAKEYEKSEYNIDDCFG
jgi:hypothetical protein